MKIIIERPDKQRDLTEGEEELLEELDGTVPQSQLEKLGSYWTTKKAPPEMSWVAKVLPYIIVIFGSMGLAANLYYQNRITETFNYLAIVVLSLLCLGISMLLSQYDKRLVNNGENFLSFDDLSMLKRHNYMIYLPFNIFAVIFFVLYIFSGSVNVITAVLFLILYYVYDIKTKEVKERVWADLETLSETYKEE